MHFLIQSDYSFRVEKPYTGEMSWLLVMEILLNAILPIAFFLTAIILIIRFNRIGTLKIRE